MTDVRRLSKPRTTGFNILSPVTLGRIEFRLPNDQRENREEAVEEPDRYDNLTHLIRFSVSKALPADGSAEPDQTVDAANVDLSYRRPTRRNRKSPPTLNRDY